MQITSAAGRSCMTRSGHSDSAVSHAGPVQFPFWYPLQAGQPRPPNTFIPYFVSVSIRRGPEIPVVTRKLSGFVLPATALGQADR